MAWSNFRGMERSQIDECQPRGTVCRKNLQLVEVPGNTNMTNSFYVYENWTHDRARVHKGECPYCNHGRAAVTELLKELHRIVNEAIRTQSPGNDQAERLTFDLSQIDMEKLRDEFAKKVSHKATAL